MQKREWKKASGVFCVVCAYMISLSCLSTWADELDAESELQARNRLLNTVMEDGAEALPVIVDSLDDEREIVRRTAAHLVVYLGDSAREAFGPALASKDGDVSRAVLDAVREAGVLEQYVEPVVTHAASSVRRYFYLSLLPEYLLVEGEPADDLVEIVSEIYYGDTEEDIRSEILRHFFLEELMEHMLVDGKPSDEYIEILEELYSDASATAREEIISTVSDLPVTEASAQLLLAVETEGRSDIARTARRAIIEDNLKSLEQLQDDGSYQQVVDEFDTKFAEEDFDTWPNDLAYEAFFIRSNAFRGLDEHESAVEDLERAISYRPARRAYRNLGYVYRDQLEAPEKAVEAFKNALESNVGFGGHVIHRSRLGAASLLRSLDRPEEALEVLEGMSGEIEDMGGYWGAGHVRSFAATHEALGDYEAAIGYYRRMLNADFGESQNEEAKGAIERLQKEVNGEG